MLNIVMTRAGEVHVTIRIHNLDANQGTLNSLVQNPANAITLLPTNWRAVAHFSRKGQALGTLTATGVDVPRNLPIGPDPQTGTGHPTWMTNLKVAFDLGMALAIDVGGIPLNELVVDRMLVYGVDHRRAPEAAARALSALFDAHYYMHGLGFVEPGTPTNNTESVASGHTRRDRAYAESYRVDPADPGGPGAVANGTRLAAALGITAPGVSLRGAAGAIERHQQASRAMQSRVPPHGPWDDTLVFIFDGRGTPAADDPELTDHGRRDHRLPLLHQQRGARTPTPIRLATLHGSSQRTRERPSAVPSPRRRAGLTARARGERSRSEDHYYDRDIGTR